MKQFNNYTILVTGGTGFIGSKTKDALEKQGYEVKTFRGDVRNIADWEEALSEVDVVFHAAGIRSETEKDFNINTKGTENLFRAISEGISPDVILERSDRISAGDSIGRPAEPDSLQNDGRVKRVILVSSQAVYSGNKSPYKESMGAVDPITIYGKSKYEAEKIAQKEGKRLGIDIIIFRYAAVFGPGIREKSNMSGSLARWVKAGLQGDPIAVYKDPNRIRNYVHIDDVVSANVLAVEKLPSGIYNVCGDEKIKLIDLAEMVKKITGGVSDVRIASVPLRPGDAGDQTASNQKLKQFGWSPRHSIEEAVREYVESLKLKIQN